MTRKNVKIISTLQDWSICAQLSTVFSLHACAVTHVTAVIICNIMCGVETA